MSQVLEQEEAKVSKKYIDQTLKNAEKLQNASLKGGDNVFAERIGPIVDSPRSKNFLIRLMDVTFRTTNYDRIARYALSLFRKPREYRGIFNKYETMMVRLFRLGGYKMSSVSIPVMLAQIRSVTSSILFYVGDKRFHEHAEQRKEDGVKLNINMIGEALLGEEEAQDRIEKYKSLLNQDDINYISIKISTIYSQINPLAYEYTVSELCQKLSILYDEVLKIEEETGEAKFVNLDMEEYRDLGLTVDTFMETLSWPQYKNLRAGIVLQAYIPESSKFLKKLQDWAKERVENGGAPIKIRIVKGANMEMEKTEASIQDWPIATYTEKKHSDANFKKMLNMSLTEESCKAVNLGVASHNVFDLSYALTIVNDRNLRDYVDFEMLEGMANAIVNKLLEEKINVLLYTPIVHAEDYNSAIAYLVRRLDEGTADGNYLKEGFKLEVGSKKWDQLKKEFQESVDLIEEVQETTNRTQNRNTEELVPQEKGFKNVPDTDFVLIENRNWIEGVKKRWQDPIAVTGDTFPVVGAIKEDKNREAIRQRGWRGTLPWKYEMADAEDYQDMIDADSEWYKMSYQEKAKIMRQAAVEIGKKRGDLIGVAVTELGKLVTEVDVEVSEAIDFANFYTHSMEKIYEEHKMEINQGGINLVLSPWNFPVAIPVGGVIASLMAGKRAILKPSTNASGCSYMVCECLWKAGVPKDALAFMPTEETNLDPFLSEGNVFDAVILTGGTGTAHFLLDRNPHLNLYAETGGKNSTIVTSLSDRDQAVKNVIQSAFSNTGQKCSATSLLILEEEVYNEERFKSLLKDAVESQIHGNPWEFETKVGPLAVPVSDKIRASIENTRKEDWLVEPQIINDFMLTPGVKWGVTKNDYEYQNELFGPILAVMKARNLKKAIELVNGVDYGLTSGIESLDRKEVDTWLESVKAGNLYANRSTTGAIVQRQPFGGIKQSSFGMGMKAGGTNYVLQFSDLKIPEKNIDDAEKDFNYWNKVHFSQKIDYVKLRGQHNINRYLKPKHVMLLIDDETEDQDILLVHRAARALNIPMEIYAKKKRSLPMKGTVGVVKSWSLLKDRISDTNVIRALNYDRIDEDFLRICHKKAVHVYGRKPVPSGRVELLNYLMEQNQSINYHRYGNLMGEKPVGED